MLQNGVYSVHVPEMSITLQGLKYSHDDLTATPYGRFLSSYPQPVDKSVDNHVNRLQMQALRSQAIAL